MDPDLPLYNFPIHPADPNSAYYWQLAFLAPARSVLEIGCATGYFSQHLTARGQRVTGVEIHPGAAAQARAVCERVITGDIETAPVKSQIQDRYDAVVLGDVLEHLRSPDQLLRHILQAWLKPGGWLVACVPNSGHWLFRREVWGGRFPYRQTGLFDRTHLHFYTHSSLNALVTACGYRVTATAYSVNPNTQEDLTFACLAFLYHRPVGHLFLRRIESRLVRLFPELFAYQFILRMQPKE